MQCSACRAVYSNALDLCPRCQTPVSQKSSRMEIFDDLLPQEQEETTAALSAETPAEAQDVMTAKTSSTLIEFPGAGRAARPQWRKDLSERVREIQERRAREAARENQEEVRAQTERPAPPSAGPQLGLVPTPDQPQVNPIVAKALKRLERAYQPPPARGRASHGGAAVAVAHVPEEQYQDLDKVEAQSAPEPLDEIQLPEAQAEPVREHTLTIVQPVEKVSPVVSQSSAPKVLMASSVDDTLADSTADVGAYEEFYDDRAPVFSRLAAGLIDLLVVAFASSPFAAIIELTNGNWADERVLASMGGILLIIMFLYLTTSTALAGRTWGMSLVSLRAVDVDTGMSPTTKQSVTRAIAYMLSLATLGLGLLYALFDAEGRTAHDHLSGTAVVRE